MAEQAVTQHTLQLYKLSLSQNEALMRALQKRVKHLEEEERVNRKTWERIATALCPKIVAKAYEADPDGLTMTIPQLGQVIIQQVKPQLLELRQARESGRTAADLREELAQTKTELAQERRLRKEAQERLASTQQTLESVQRRVKESPAGEERPTQMSMPITVPPDQMPKWVQKWQREKSYRRDVALLQILAETGVPRRSEAAAMFAQNEGIKDPNSGTIIRLFKRCTQKGLIELIEARSDTKGSPIHHLIRLTEKGEDTCRLILNLKPAPSQATELIDRHKSPEHTLLNLEAHDLLEGAGHVVDLFPDPLQLPDDHLFVPDLIASYGGQTMYIEVERDVVKVDEAWNRKLLNYYRATSGYFHIVVADSSALENISGKVWYWARGHDLVSDLSLWMTSVSDAKGKHGQDVWLYKRDKARR